MIDFTIVLGVDRHTIRGMDLVLPTWRKHKPSLFKQPWIVFYDQVSDENIDDLLEDVVDLQIIKWPTSPTEYPRSNQDKWTNSQRAKMLAGFVHIPKYVKTEYWLKLDLDVLATGNDDWVDDEWFDGNPVIVAPSWKYTKPAMQMVRLDKWVFNNAIHADMSPLASYPPLNLIPLPGATKVAHPRICSWCGFFQTDFSKLVSGMCEATCGNCQIPVDSQDGLMFYAAKRMELLIQTVPMKKYGWQLCRNIDAVASVLKEIK